MLNLLKSDLYRLTHGKMIWICSAIVACAMLLSIGMSWLITTDAFRTLVEQSASTSQATRGDFAIMVGGSDVNPDQLDSLAENALTMPGMTNLVAANISEGFLTMMIGLFTALFLLSDFETGFVKGILSARRRKTVYYLEKTAIIALMSLVFLLLSIASAAIGGAIAGFTFTDPETAGAFLLWSGLAWLIVFTYGCITACVTWITRSKAAGVVTAVAVAGSLLESIILSIGGGLFKGVSIIADALSWLPLSSLSLTAQGSSGLSTSETWGHVLITGLVCVLAFSAISLSATRKKDI